MGQQSVAYYDHTPQTNRCSMMATFLSLIYWWPISKFYYLTFSCVISSNSIPKGKILSFQLNTSPIVLYSCMQWEIHPHMVVRDFSSTNYAHIMNTDNELYFWIGSLGLGLCDGECVAVCVSVWLEASKRKYTVECVIHTHAYKNL